MRCHHKILPVIVAGLLALSAGGAEATTGQGTTDGFPMTVENCGRDIVIEQPPERVLTIGSGASTLMAAAGAADKIVGRMIEGGAPLGPADEALADVPEISPGGDISLEVILGERPDLLIGWPLDTIRPEDLADAGVPWLFDASFCYQFGMQGEELSWEDLYSDIELYGRLSGTEDTAAAAVADLRERVAAVEAQVRGLPERTVAVVYVTDTSLQVYGRESMAHTQVETLGLDDVFGDVGKGAEVSFEELIDLNPDVIIAAYYGPEGVTTDEDVQQTLRGFPGLDRVDAVREGRIIALEATYIESSGLNVDGLEIMAERIAKFFP